MRAPIFQSILFFLLALLPITFAETTVSTYFLTRTVYRVNTVTMTGTPPSSVLNTTSTIPASIGTILPNSATANYTLSGTGTPTASMPSSAPSTVSTGAASQMNANAYLAMLVAGIGYMAL